MPNDSSFHWERPLLITLMLGSLLTLSYLLMRQFFVCIAWAGIFVYVSWPLYGRLRRAMPPNLAAALMTAAMLTGFVLPLFGLVSIMQAELATAFSALSGFMSETPRALPESIARIPWLGEWLQRIVDQAPPDWATLKSELAGWIQEFRNELAKIALEFGRISILLVLTVITAFFLYRDGHSLLRQLRQALHLLVGSQANIYFDAVGTTTKAVLYGILFAALAQGSMAGIGYWVAGLSAPLLLAIFTTLIAMLPVPFGTPIVWSGIGLWLIATDRTVPGVGLLIWGALVVSWIDNLVRPLVISGTANVHFLLVLFGILGGLTTFGLVGLFAGPAILATLAAVWRIWLQERTSPDSTMNEHDRNS